MGSARAPTNAARPPRNSLLIPGTYMKIIIKGEKTQ
jgi:hypothetical protein